MDVTNCAQSKLSHALSTPLLSVTTNQIWSGIKQYIKQWYRHTIELFFKPLPFWSSLLSKIVTIKRNFNIIMILRKFYLCRYNSLEIKTFLPVDATFLDKNAYKASILQKNSLPIWIWFKYKTNYFRFRSINIIHRLKLLVLFNIAYI